MTKGKNIDIKLTFAPLSVRDIHNRPVRLQSTHSIGALDFKLIVRLSSIYDLIYEIIKIIEIFLSIILKPYI